MNSAIVGVVVFAMTFGGVLAGMVLRKVLPWMVGLTLIGIGTALAYDFASAGRNEAAVLTAICMPYMPLQPLESVVRILPTTVPSMR